MKDRNYPELVNRVIEIAEQPHTPELAELLSWQRSLRSAVDRLVAERLRRPFFDELTKRLAIDTILAKRDAATWANEFLRETQLSIAFPETGRPAFLTANQNRVSSNGRLRLETFGPGRHQLSRRIENCLNDLQLVPEQRLVSQFASKNRDR